VKHLGLQFLVKAVHWSCDWNEAMLVSKIFWLWKHLNSLCFVHFWANDRNLENNRSSQHVRMNACFVTSHWSRSYRSIDRLMSCFTFSPLNRIWKSMKSNLTEVIESLSLCFLMSLLSSVYLIRNDQLNSQFYNTYSSINFSIFNVSQKRSELRLVRHFSENFENQCHAFS